MVSHARLLLVNRSCDLVSVLDKFLGGSWSAIVRGHLSGGSELVTHYVQVFSSTMDVKTVEKGVKKSCRAYRVVVQPCSGRRGYLMVLKEPCSVCKVLYSGSEHVVLSHSIYPGGYTFVSLATMNKSVLKGLIDRLQEADESISIERVEEVEGPSPLSGVQARVLLYAYVRGYYDVPRRINLDKLARELGMSRSAVADALRRAEAKIVKKYFEEGLA